nr:hypothetical protein [Lachnospiraceae bacterium]
MIRSLRKKFIAITMLSVFLVLFAIFFAIIISNYISVITAAEERMDLLVENGGSFLDFEDKMKKPGDEKEPPEMKDSPSENKHLSDIKKPFFDQNKLSAETPFDSRYFTATFDSEGNVTKLETDRIYTISDETAKKKATAIYNQNTRFGFDGNFRFRTTTIDGNVMVLFLDCTRELETFRSFLTQSIAVVAIGIFSIFILVVFLSGI